MMRRFLVFASLWIAFAVDGAPIKNPLYGPSYDRLLNHPGDYPLPTEMTFRHYADHIVDQTTEYFDPDLVNRGDTIFLADWHVTWFVREIHAKIKHPYIVIFNDTDGANPDAGVWFYDDTSPGQPSIHAIRTLLYDPKVAAWFCKNMLLSRHPKIVQIPIGQNIIYWGNCPREIFPLLHQETFPKKHLLYMNVQLATNPIRRHVAALFQDQPYCFSRINNLQQQSVSRVQFYEELSQAQFTVAPRGLGLDTVRFWEAVVLDCIPIVKRSELDDLYSGLPVVFIDEWEEVNEEFLKQKYAEIKSANLGKEKAYYDYWAEKIEEVKKSVCAGTNGFSSLEMTKFKSETLNVLSELINSKTAGRDKLLYQGAASSLRPLELAERCPALSKIYLHDLWGPWEGEWVGEHLESFVNTHLFSYFYRLMPLNYYDSPHRAFNRSDNEKTHVFLDLSYLRHRVADQLDFVYPRAVPGALICGNMAEEPYVRRMLEKFSKSTGAQINFLGDVWYFIR